VTLATYLVIAAAAFLAEAPSPVARDDANFTVPQPPGPVTIHPRRAAAGKAARRAAPPPSSHEVGAHVPSDPPAKFFVNQGLVTSRTDIQHLLRPIIKQTVSYRFFRGRDLVANGTGWVERVVADEPAMSTYFTPISITINVDSFEHLEFETRPDQLLVYTLVQGDERVVVEFVPGITDGDEGPSAPRQLEFDTSGFVQMELLGLEGAEEQG
jgi:hypothetical protein